MYDQIETAIFGAIIVIGAVSLVKCYCGAHDVILVTRESDASSYKAQVGTSPDSNVHW